MACRMDSISVTVWMIFWHSLLLQEQLAVPPFHFAFSSIRSSFGREDFVYSVHFCKLFVIFFPMQILFQISIYMYLFYVFDFSLSIFLYFFQIDVSKYPQMKDASDASHPLSLPLGYDCYRIIQLNQCASVVRSVQSIDYQCQLLHVVDWELAICREFFVRQGIFVL